MTPSGIEPATFRLVAQYLKQMRHRVLPAFYGTHNFTTLSQKGQLIISQASLIHSCGFTSVKTLKIFQGIALIIYNLQLATTTNMVTILNTVLRKSNFADTAELTGHFKTLFIINALKSGAGCSYGNLKFSQM
jgi:hypothetical protein